MNACCKPRNAHVKGTDVVCKTCGSVIYRNVIHEPDSKTQSARSTAQLECGLPHAALAPAPAEGENPGRLFVRITSVRRRLLDPDNLCEKYHLDCVRRAGVIRDDSAEAIALETRQRKAVEGEEEHTLIEVSSTPFTDL